jgi:hypothetical protein
MPRAESGKSQAERFSEEVNKKFKEGYHPIGGVAIIAGLNGHLDFYQAMISDH